MNQIVLLVISLLSLSSALESETNHQNCHHSTDSLRVSKRESPLEQLFPSLSLNRLQNESMFLREINSAINYANFSIRRAIQETQNLFNLTAGQYNSSDMAIIMAFPTSNTSQHENVLYNSSSNRNPSYGLNEVKDGQNFSARFLDLNELLTLLQTPLNQLSNKFHTPTTTPVVYVEPTHKQVYEESYPAVPAAPMLPVVPAIPYEVPYEVKEAPRVVYEEPKHEPKYEEPKHEPKYEEPKAPIYESVPAKAQVEYKPQPAPYN